MHRAENKDPSEPRSPTAIRALKGEPRSPTRAPAAQSEPRSPKTKRRRKYPITISIKCDAAWLARLQMRMDLCGTKNRSEFIRQAILEQPVIERESPQVEHFRAQIARLGNNLNQAVHLAHGERLEGRSIPVELLLERIDELIGLFDHILKRLHQPTTRETRG